MTHHHHEANEHQLADEAADHSGRDVATAPPRLHVEPRPSDDRGVMAGGLEVIFVERHGRNVAHPPRGGSGGWSSHIIVSRQRTLCSVVVGRYMRRRGLSKLRVELAADVVECLSRRVESHRGPPAITAV